MAAKKNNYIEIELEFAEKQLESWKAYIEAHPVDQLKHDIEWKSTKTGGSMPMVIASIQQQGKFLQETLKNYLALLKEVDLMREKEDVKKSNPRGEQALSPMEEKLI